MKLGFAFITLYTIEISAELYRMLDMCNANEEYAMHLSALDPDEALEFFGWIKTDSAELQAVKKILQGLEKTVLVRIIQEV